MKNSLDFKTYSGPEPLSNLKQHWNVAEVALERKEKVMCHKTGCILLDNIIPQHAALDRAVL